MVDRGYIKGGVYHYYMTDHLGNNRVVINASGTVTQRNHYYPSGTAFAENTTEGQKKQPYKYNGKELDQMHGLNLYDYSARYYESAIGRFTAVDPLAEDYYSWSPYAYVGNNPISSIDPTGMDTIYFDHKGHLDSNRTKTGGNDVIYVTDRKGNIHMQAYDAGTFKEYGSDNNTGDGYFYLSTNNEENSKDVFEFLADHTSVEWGILHARIETIVCHTT